MINIQNLSFAYKGDTPIFQNFDLSILPQERWSIIGPSGCGKTTLLYLLSGLLTPTEGKININQDFTKGNKCSTGLILQDYGLLPWATAFENIALGLKIRGFDKAIISQTTRQWLSELGLETVSKHYPSQLSGGQRQRVAIARTLALKPGLLLMDEPFASLDTLTREDLLELTLTLWRKQPSTMILVTHNIEEAVFWGNQILILKQHPNITPIIIKNQGSGSNGYKSSSDFNVKCKLLREMIEQSSRNINQEPKI